MMTFFPSRPIIVSLGAIDIRWYGLMYVLAFIIALYPGRRLARYRSLSVAKDRWAAIVFWTAVGVVVGGRLGYVVFYEPGYYAAHIWEIFMLAGGGMSAHGGLLGAVWGLWYSSRYAQKAQQDIFWSLADVAVVPAAIGLALGRLGNFINQEIYGTVTTVPWAIVIPDVAGPRHPWPIYEALTNALLALAAYSCLRWAKLKPGMVAAAFVVSYSLIRFLLEYLRAREWPDFSVGHMLLVTRGQALSLPILLVGAFLMLWLAHPSKNSTKN